MLEIPGYKEALAWEQERREESFLGVTGSICGVPIGPLTLRRLTFLFVARSAFFYRPTQDAADVALFLWIISPAFRPGDMEARALFLAALREIGALDELPKALAEINEYLDAAFNDQPASRVSANAENHPSDICFTASLVGEFACEYGWSLEEIMESPISVLYQLLHHTGLRKDPNHVFMSRRSGKAKGDYCRALNAKAKAGAEEKAKLT